MRVISDIERTYNSLNIHSVMIQILEVVYVCFRVSDGGTHLYELNGATMICKLQFRP